MAGSPQEMMCMAKKSLGVKKSKRNSGASTILSSHTPISSAHHLWGSILMIFAFVGPSIGPLEAEIHLG